MDKKKPIDLASHTNDSELESFVSKLTVEQREIIKNKISSTLIKNKTKENIDYENAFIDILYLVNKLKKLKQALSNSEWILALSEEDIRKILIIIDNALHNVRVLYRKNKNDLNYKILESLTEELEKIRIFFHINY